MFAYFTIFLPQSHLKSIRRSDKKQETVGFDQKQPWTVVFANYMISAWTYPVWDWQFDSFSLITSQPVRGEGTGSKVWGSMADKGRLKQTKAKIDNATEPSAQKGWILSSWLPLPDEMAQLFTCAGTWTHPFPGKRTFLSHQTAHGTLTADGHLAEKCKRKEREREATKTGKQSCDCSRL